MLCYVRNQVHRTGIIICLVLATQLFLLLVPTVFICNHCEYIVNEGEEM